jgi:hypothetical protein
MRTKEALVETYPNEFEARLLADILRGEGIRSVIKLMGAGSALGGGAPTFMPHSVYVLEEDLERAKAVADSVESGDPTGSA